MGMVDFEEIDEADADELRALISEHEQRTGSPVAARVLEQWDALLPRFVKVMPTDYRRVLDAHAAAALAAAANGDGPHDEPAPVAVAANGDAAANGASAPGERFTRESSQEPR